MNQMKQQFVGEMARMESEQHTALREALKRAEAQQRTLEFQMQCRDEVARKQEQHRERELDQLREECSVATGRIREWRSGAHA